MLGNILVNSGTTLSISMESLSQFDFWIRYCKKEILDRDVTWIVLLHCSKSVKMCIISLAAVISLEIQKDEGEEAMFKFNFSTAFRCENCRVDQMSSAKLKALTFLKLYNFLTKHSKTVWFLFPSSISCQIPLQTYSLD